MRSRLAYWLYGFLLSVSLVMTVQASEEPGLDLEAMVAELDQSEAQLKALNSLIDTAPEADRVYLVFQRDQRTLQLLRHTVRVVNGAADLEDRDPVRLEVTGRLQSGFTGESTDLLRHLSDLDERIDKAREELDSYSGTGLVVAQAAVLALEGQQFQFYQELTDLVVGAEQLGVAGDSVAADLGRRLPLLAEILVGRVEATNAALKGLSGRQTYESDNADISAASSGLKSRMHRNLSRLQALVVLFQKLELDASDYQGLLLKHAEGLSLSTLQKGAVKTVFLDSWDLVVGFVTEKLPDLLFKLIIFFGILLLFRFLSRIVRRLIRLAFERPGVTMSTLLKDVIVSMCGGLVMAIGLLIALGQIGISLGPMLAGLGVAGFIIGFALQDTLGNFAAGAMILVYRPYDVDDLIEVTGAVGRVKKMSLVSTTILTFDNQTLVVPNSKIWGDVIKNVTGQQIRRVDMVFGIGYADDIAHAERVLESVLRSDDRVLDDPEPRIKLHELGDSSVNFIVRPWVKTEDYWDVYWNITRQVKLRFDEEGISIPFPQRDVHLYSEST